MFKTSKQREDYALRRMSAALERVLGNGSKEMKAKAVWWIAAWKACHAMYLQERDSRPSLMGLDSVWQDTCPESQRSVRAR